jgi:hypothetical protein
VEAFDGLTLGSCLQRGEAQDRRFELELAGSESQGKNIKEWLKAESYFECGRRIKYAQRKNQEWELVVVEGQSEGQIVGVITSMWRRIPTAAAKGTTAAGARSGGAPGAAARKGANSEGRQKGSGSAPRAQGATATKNPFGVLEEQEDDE